MNGILERLRYLSGIMTISLIMALTVMSVALSQPPPQTQNVAEKRALFKEINRDVWIPFSEAYAANDAEKYLKLHTENLIRASGNGKSVNTLAEYGEGVRRMMQTGRERGVKAAIRFRFLERIAQSSIASERGIYEFSTINAEGKTSKFYGKFHVFLRKEQNVWKIAVDYDSNEGNTIGLAAFDAAKTLDDFESF